MFKRNIYHPGFKGSFSIKKVSPVLVADGYEGLTISCGEDVLPAWERLSDPDISADEKRQLRQSLLDYCKQDTQVMVELLTAVSEFLSLLYDLLEVFPKARVLEVVVPGRNGISEQR